MNLFQKISFISHAGLPLNWKIECDALSEDDWKGIARMIMDYEKRPFGSVEGIPRGGIPLAKALSEYATEGPPMIVDDVYTTGTSFKEFIAENYPDEKVICWTVFARDVISGNINALFQMPSSMRPKLK